MTANQNCLFRLHDEDSAFTDDHVLCIKEDNYEETLMEQLLGKYTDTLYSDLPTSKDVKYDKHGYLGKKFRITGNAQLDDYYNWGYRDTEDEYFCISIRPDGGDYGDTWYIYASRTTYRSLFEQLKKNGMGLTIIAKLEYADTGTDCMATLVEYVEK